MPLKITVSFCKVVCSWRENNCCLQRNDALVSTKCLLLHIGINIYCYNLFLPHKHVSVHTKHFCKENSENILFSLVPKRKNGENSENPVLLIFPPLLKSHALSKNFFRHDNFCWNFPLHWLDRIFSFFKIS